MPQVRTAAQILSIFNDAGARIHTRTAPGPD